MQMKMEGMYWVGPGGEVLDTFTYFIFGVSEKDRDTSQLERQVPTHVLLHVLGI
jgi:hypothetical protein